MLAGKPHPNLRADGSKGRTEQVLCGREQCSVRNVNRTLSFAFLAPDLVKAAIDGRLPHGMGVTRFADLPAEWSRQRRILGLAPR